MLLVVSFCIGKAGKEGWEVIADLFACHFD